MGFGVAASCLTILCIAALLTPSRRGFGTHTGLGLPQCEFLARTGIPCPSCGMTTSFAWFVRGHLLRSFYVQPMGFILAGLAYCSFWGGLYLAITGRPVYRVLWIIPSRYYVVPLLAWAMLAWAWKIFSHLHGLEAV